MVVVTELQRAHLEAERGGEEEKDRRRISKVHGTCMEGSRRGTGHGMSKVKVIRCLKSWERAGHG